MYAGFAGAKTGYCHMALRGRYLMLTFCHFPAALTPPGRGHPQPVQAVRCNKIAGSDFEQLKAGPNGGGQDARSNPATPPTTEASSASRSSGSVRKVKTLRPC